MCCCFNLFLLSRAEIRIQIFYCISTGIITILESLKSVLPVSTLAETRLTNRSMSEAVVANYTALFRPDLPFSKNFADDAFGISHV